MTPTNLKWHGWTDENGSKVDFFNKHEIDCKCTIPCEQCGFSHLDNTGGGLTKSNTPLCGVW